MKKIKHMDRLVIRGIGKLLFGNWLRFIVIIFGIKYLIAYFG
jgi:hypothetical protein|tara:strand:+ start:295 stop:420 length:126 start_codon:yes stop_codon:yes gene_type:complete